MGRQCEHQGEDPTLAVWRRTGRKELGSFHLGGRRGHGSSGQHLEGRPGACQCLPCGVSAGIPPEEPQTSAGGYAGGAWEEETCAPAAWRSTAAFPLLSEGTCQTASLSMWSLPQGLALGQPTHLVEAQARPLPTSAACMAEGALPGLGKSGSGADGCWELVAPLPFLVRQG